MSFIIVPYSCSLLIIVMSCWVKLSGARLAHVSRKACITFWEEVGAHGVETRAREQPRWGLFRRNIWRRRNAIDAVVWALQHLRKISSRQQLLLSSFQGESRKRGNVHFLKSQMCWPFELYSRQFKINYQICPGEMQASGHMKIERKKEMCTFFVCLCLNSLWLQNCSSSQSFGKFKKDKEITGVDDNC